MILYCIERVTSLYYAVFHRRRVLSPWCATNSSFLQFNLIIELTRKIYTTRNRLPKIQSFKMVLLKLCLSDRKRHISGSFFIGNVLQYIRALAWRSRRRCILVISRYISYHVYLHITVPDFLAKRKPWALTIPSRTCWYLSNKYVFFLFIHICEYVRYRLFIFYKNW